MEDKNLDFFIETSAKNGNLINELFLSLIKRLLIKNNPKLQSFVRYFHCYNSKIDKLIGN
jgi:hypothetical protein